MYTRYLRKLQEAKKRKIKICILGSTPELRDWAYQERMDVTVVDYNEENYKVLSSFMLHKDIQEELVISNWKSMTFNKKFDLIIGDHAVSVVQREIVGEVLASVKNALEDDGIFISKHYTRLPEDKQKSLETILENYYKEFFYYNIFFFTTDIVTSQTDPVTDYFSFGKTWEILKEFSTKGKLKKEDLELFQSLNWENMKYNLYCPLREEWENVSKKYFQTIEKEFSEDIYAEGSPIYILKK